MRIKPGLDDSTVVTQPSFVVPPRAGKTKFEHNSAHEFIRSATNLPGKSGQAF